MKKILSNLKVIFSDSLYIWIDLYTMLIVGYVSYWLFYRTTKIETFIGNMQNGDFGSYSMLYGVTYIITTIFIIILSGVSAASSIWLFKHSKLGTLKGAGANFGGFVAAAFGMGCPVCGAFLLSAVGVVGGLTIFPFKGLELKFLSLAFLAGSTIYAASKVNPALDCKECADINHNHQSKPQKIGQRILTLRLDKLIIPLLIILFILNQVLITKVSVATGAATSAGFLGQILNIKTKSSYFIIAPKLNPDGKTTSLVEQPTITEVPANPNTGDALADAKVVMQATGKPFYAPDDISFDDPINAQKKWGAYVKSINLSGDQKARYEKLISTMVCSYCCGTPTSVTLNKQCGCAHANAVRGFYKFMIQNYGDKYSDEQLIGESHRWYALWYPKGMLEDYLLATGKGDVLGHQTHGGAGVDGRHGL